MSSQASRIQQTRSRNHCQLARFANGQNMLVKDGYSSHEDSNSKLVKYRMVENERTTRTESQNARGRGQVKGSSARMAQSHAKSLETSKNVTEQLTETT